MQPTKRQRVSYTFDGLINAARSLLWSDVLQFVGWPADNPEMLPVPHNVVLTAIIAGGQPIFTCRKQLNSKHNPGQFASAQLKLSYCKLLNYFVKQPTLQHTGRCISVGAKTPNAAFDALIRLRNSVYVSAVRQAERFYFAKQPSISNIVFSGAFSYAFDIAKIAAAHPSIVTYAPENFSGGCVKPFPDKKGRTGKIFELGGFTTLGVVDLPQAIELELALITLSKPFRVEAWRRKSKLAERVQEVQTEALAQKERAFKKEVQRMYELLDDQIDVEEDKY
jgi:TATA-box binding protein (TBP) (component of TFIID and TFIIIB)